MAQSTEGLESVRDELISLSERAKLLAKTVDDMIEKCRVGEGPAPIVTYKDVNGFLGGAGRHGNLRRICACGS